VGRYRDDPPVQRRRRGSGAAAAAPAEKIRLGDIVRLLEEGQAVVERFALCGGDCPIDGKCGLKPRVRAAERAFLAEHDRTSLAGTALPASPTRIGASCMIGPTRTAGLREMNPATEIFRSGLFHIAEREQQSSRYRGDLSCQSAR
jgi:hypothetical protein